MQLFHALFFLSFSLRTGARQPDNYEGLKEGPINTEFDIGVTIEGLQEYHDEACLSVQNNAYGEGIAWHDVACHFRSVIVCEDSDQLMSLVHSQEGEDIKDSVKQSERQVELESISLNEVAPIRHPNPPPPPSAPHSAPPHSHHGPHHGGPGGGGPHHPPHHQRRPQRLAPRRPTQPQKGFLGALRGRFPFLF